MINKEKQTIFEETESKMDLETKNLLDDWRKNKVGELKK